MFARVLVYLTLLSTVLFASPEIILKDGSILKGEILSETDTILVLKTKFGEQTIPLTDVKEIIRQKQQVIHLKDGSVINGRVVSTSMGVSTVETAFGTQKIPESEISRIEYDRSIPQPSTGTSLASKAFEDIGTSMLYNSQKKSIATGLGFQMLGGGLLYAEKKTPGIIMLLAETGLIIVPSMVGVDSDLAGILIVSGIGLKTINTIWTVSAISEYNRNLRVKLGLLEEEKSRKIERFDSVKYSFDTGSTLTLTGSSSEGGSLRFNFANFGFRMNQLSWIRVSLSGEGVTHLEEYTGGVSQRWKIADLAVGLRTFPNNRHYFYMVGGGISLTKYSEDLQLPNAWYTEGETDETVSPVLLASFGFEGSLGLFHITPEVGIVVRIGDRKPYSLGPSLTLNLGLNI